MRSSSSTVSAVPPHPATALTDGPVPARSQTPGTRQTAQVDLRDLPAPPLLRRMACWLYEGVLLFGVVFIAGYLFSALSQSRHALTHRHGLMAFLFVVLGLYFVWFWSHGQTLAMKTWHIRMVDVQGRAPRQGRALLRYLAAWVWFLPPLLLAWALQASGAGAGALAAGWILLWGLASRLHPQRQFLHDALVGTRLVSHRPAKR